MSTHIDWNMVFQRDLKRNIDFSNLTPNKLSELLNKIELTGGKVIDLGCGTGLFTRELYHRGFDVVGVDISSDAIGLAKQASRYIPYIQANLEENSAQKLLTDKYDLAICKFVLAFIDKRQEFISRAQKLLTKNGVFAIINPTLDQVIPEKRHIAVDLEETLNLLKAVFKKVDYYETNNLTVFIAKK